MRGRRSWYAPEKQLGIPDYRGPTGLASRAMPVTYQTFTGSAAARCRYCARSHLGWRYIAQAVPNHTRSDTCATATLDVPLGRVLTALVTGLEDW